MLNYPRALQKIVKKALKRAKEAYSKRIGALGGVEAVNANERWRILSEETTRSGAVDNGAAALELLLDSDRVYEDLEYALRGPPESWNASSSSCSIKLGDGSKLKWNMSLVARAWDPRLKPESEFRGICWDSKLTCLCQYYHPLMFPEVFELKDQIQQDVIKTFNNPKILNAVNRLGRSLHD